MNTEFSQQAKKTVRDFHAAFDAANVGDITDVLAAHTSDDYFWRGMHPFYEQTGAAAVAEIFWMPLRRSFASLQRREDVFMAGENFVDDGKTIWVVSMGNLMGLFDRDWLGIPATRKMAFLRYAEFHRVENGKIAESAFFCDVLSIMHQAGCYPLPPPTGANIIQPGPRTHDGLMLEAQPPEEGEKTLALVNQMVADLSALNKSGDDRCPPEVLQKTWHDDMIWYGPTGIGATYTIPRYQEQHQYPFRTQLKDKVFNGHIARVAEGNYLGFFGWANLTNTPTGGFLGLPGNNVRADMRVVDIYRRDGDKLAENWVFIDLLHWLSMQGLDVLARLRDNS
ncbi:MAG: nuclear transport factor 2 family protein [Gammaproteobacteria bacterium]|nr:nuclear transport factor 2 family protein [Gammaproteobacteria bacterium]